MIKYIKKKTKINKRDSQCVNAFEKFKRLLIDLPSLKFQDFTKKFMIATDESYFAIGSVLMQDDHLLSYASRTLNDHEKNYSTTEKKDFSLK